MVAHSEIAAPYTPEIQETSQLQTLRSDAITLLKRHAVKETMPVLRGVFNDLNNVLFAGQTDLLDHNYPFGHQYSVKGTIDEEKGSSVAVVVFTYRRKLENVNTVEIRQDGTEESLVLKKNGGYILEKTRDEHGHAHTRRKELSRDDLSHWREQLALLTELAEETPHALDPNPAVPPEETQGPYI